MLRTYSVVILPAERKYAVISASGMNKIDTDTIKRFYPNGKELIQATYFKEPHPSFNYIRITEEIAKLNNNELHPNDIQKTIFGDADAFQCVFEINNYIN